MWHPASALFPPQQHILNLLHPSHSQLHWPNSTQACFWLLLVSFSFSLLASYVGPLSEFTTAIQSCKLMLHRPIGGVKGQRWKSTHFTDENFSLFSCNWRWENGMWFANLVVQHQLPHCQTDDWKAEGGADVPKTLKIEEFTHTSNIHLLPPDLTYVFRWCSWHSLALSGSNQITKITSKSISENELRLCQYHCRVSCQMSDVRC